MIKASPSLWEVSFWSSVWLLPWDTKLSLLPPLLVPSYTDFWETHLHPIVMFHMSWEVAVTGQPGKTTHSAGLICDFNELFCSQGLIFQELLYFLVVSLLISVPILNYDGNLT